MWRSVWEEDSWIAPAQAQARGPARGRWKQACVMLEQQGTVILARPALEWGTWVQVLILCASQPSQEPHQQGHCTGSRAQSLSEADKCSPAKGHPGRGTGTTRWLQLGHGLGIMGDMIEIASKFSH